MEGNTLFQVALYSSYGLSTVVIKVLGCQNLGDVMTGTGTGVYLLRTLTLVMDLIVAMIKSMFHALGARAPVSTSLPPFTLNGPTVPLFPDDTEEDIPNTSDCFLWGENGKYQLSASTYIYIAILRL